MMIVPEIHGLRQMKQAEADLFSKWEKFERPYPWSETQFLETINSEKQQTLVWENDEGIVGYGVLQVIDEEAYLLNILVDPIQRRKGNGVTLVGKLLEWSRSCGAKQFFLDVDPDNTAALQLYRKTGFQVTGRRPQAYPRGEASILMRKDL